MKTKTDIIVRPALHPDTDGILAADSIGRSERERMNRLYHAISSRVCHVAERDGNVVGYGVLDYSFFGNGFIPLLCVREDVQRQGIASTITEYLQRNCRTAKIFSTCAESNEAARGLFTKLDFIESGRIEHLHDSDTQIVYYKDLAK